VRVAHVSASGATQALPKASYLKIRTWLLGLAALLVALAALSVGYNIAHNDRVFRGVSVLGKDLGGMSRAEASAALAQVATGYPSDSIAVAGQGKAWTFSPADLGVSLDVDKTADAALAVGRADNFPANLGTQVGTLFGGAHVTPVLKSDAALIVKAIAGIAAELDRPAVDSKLVQGADGKVQITPSSSGSVVDRPALQTALTAAVASVPFAPVNVTMQAQAPKVTEDALKASESQALLLTEQPVVLKAGKQTWTIAPEELRKMLTLSQPQGGGDWTARLDNNALAAYLQPIADAVHVEPTNANVVIGKGTVTLKEDKSGADLDAPAAIDAIQQAASQADAAARTVALPIKEVSADIHTADVQALYDKANGLVTQGVRVRFRDDGYIMRSTAVTGFIDVAKAQGGPGPLKLVVDEDVLASRISGIAYNFNRPAADARFRMVNGAPTKVAAAKEGLKVNVSNSLQNALSAIDGYKGGDRLQVDLDVSVTQPTITDADISTIHTPDLLGTGQTSYAGSSAERAWNVGLGARNVNGALIPPGGVFSTVDAIGDLTLDAGFKMGYAIVNLGGDIKTVPAEAGGICQVATTLFHSVFWAGLPIVERNYHSYWIGTYGRPPSGLQGLDATIAPPEKDFRFKNTTGSWLLVKANADGKTLTFQLYGVKTGWKVTTSGPVITNMVKTNTTSITEYNDQLPAGKKVLVEHAQDGFDASITRTVTDASGNVLDKWTARSHYAPAHERYLIGSGSGN
jgi:vancomycin resistance protein YoaR